MRIHAHENGNVDFITDDFYRSIHVDDKYFNQCIVDYLSRYVTDDGYPIIHFSRDINLGEYEEKIEKLFNKTT